MKCDSGCTSMLLLIESENEMEKNHSHGAHFESTVQLKVHSLLRFCLRTRLQACHKPDFSPSMLHVLNICLEKKKMNTMLFRLKLSIWFMGNSMSTSFFTVFFVIIFGDNFRIYF